MFVVSHDAYGSCGYLNDPSCELVYVQLVQAVPGQSISCSAAGAGTVQGWGPATLTAGGDGNSARVNRDSRNRQMFDTSSDRFHDGQYSLGTDAYGITCN
jgi:hypothetical protein